MIKERFELDKKTILDRLGGDEEIFSMMLSMYLDEFENHCRQLAEALAAGDQTRLQREAHTVKGLLATLADDWGTEQAYVIEQEAKAGNLAGLDENSSVLQARLRQVAAAVKGLTTV